VTTLAEAAALWTALPAAERTAIVERREKALRFYLDGTKSKDLGAPDRVVFASLVAEERAIVALLRAAEETGP